MAFRKKYIKEKIKKVTPKKPFYKKWYIWLSLISGIIFLVGLYFVFFYPGFQVEKVIISGNDKVARNDLENIILNGSHTGLLKFGNLAVISRSLFLVNTDEIDKQILKKYPIIEKVSLQKKYPQTITLGIVERKPVGVYCADEINSQCFLIDENGVIYQQISMDQNNYAVIKQMIEDKNTYVGENVVRQNVVTAIRKLKKDLEEKFHINVEQAFISSPVRVDITTDQGWKIYLNTDGDPDIDAQIIKLNLLLGGKINPADMAKLQYIDLRFKDMANYK